MQDQNNVSEVTLRDYIRVLFRQKFVILLSIVTVMLTVLLGLEWKTPEYKSSVRMLISAEKQVDSPYYRDLMARNEVGLTQSEIVKSTPVLERAVQALSLHEMPFDFESRFSSPLKKAYIKYTAKGFQEKLAEMPEEQRNFFRFKLAVAGLRKAVEVEPIRDTNLFSISVTHYSPELASILANVISRSYVIYDLEQQMAELRQKYGEKHLVMKQLSDSIAQVSGTLHGRQVNNIEALGPASVKIIDQASFPLSPEGLPSTATMGLAFVMSLFLGVMLAFAFEYTDATFKSNFEVENELALPILGSIPVKNKLSPYIIVDSRIKNSYSTAYARLADQLYLMLKDKKLKTLLLISASNLSNDDFMPMNTALMMGEKSRKKMLVIDANLRHSGMARRLKLESSPGLGELLEDKATLEDTIRKSDLGFSFMPAGSTELNPVTLLDSERFTHILDVLGKKFDQVLIYIRDSHHEVKDVEVIAQKADAAAVIVNEGITRRIVVKNFLQSLKEKQPNILGVIVNNRSYVIPKVIYDRV